MSYLLDTNHCVYLKNAYFKRPERRTVFETKTLARFERHHSLSEPIYVSVVSIAELYFGAERSAYKEKNFRKVEFLKDRVTIVDLSDGLWRFFASTKAELVRRGKGITDFDLLIACTAHFHGHILVSNDSDHQVIPEAFLLENWSV